MATPNPLDQIIYQRQPTKSMPHHISLAEADIVLRSRLRLEGHFPWPETVMANLLYALTEYGEYMDELIRLQRPNDTRNHEHGRHLLKELGQIGYMLASGLCRADLNPKVLDDEPNAILDQTILSTSHMHTSTDLAFAMLCAIKAGHEPYRTEDPEATTARHLLHAWAQWCHLVRWHRNTSVPELLLNTARDFEDKRIPANAQ